MRIETSIPTSPAAAALMAQLQDSRDQLRNPKLITLARQTICERINKLQLALTRLRIAERENNTYCNTH
jgi:hypothetical protein